MHGKERLLSVGQDSDVSPAQARKAKEVARAQVAEGIDPSEAKQEAKAIAFGALLRDVDAFEGQATTRIGLQLLALTAQRPGEIRHAKWEEFDFQEKIWSLPASKMKMRRDHNVPLPDQAIALLDELRMITGNGEYLFPSLRSWQRPMSENTLNAALRRMGYSGEEMTAHGFRASFSTLANESGLWNPDAIEAALAHVERNEVRKAYSRGLYWDERVKLADWWARFSCELKAA